MVKNERYIYLMKPNAREYGSLYSQMFLMIFFIYIYIVYLKKKEPSLEFLSVRRCGRKSNDPQQGVFYADDPDIPEGVGDV